MSATPTAPFYFGQVLKPGARVRRKAFSYPIGGMAYHHTPEAEGYVRSQVGTTVYLTVAEDGTGEILSAALGDITVLAPDAWADKL